MVWRMRHISASLLMGRGLGVFKIVIPTASLSREPLTYASTLKHLSQASYVPSMVPEPSSLLAVGSFLGLVPLYSKEKQ